MQESLGHYRLLRKLGEGGMGVVYAAEDQRLGRTVALKTLRAGLADREARDRLRREARLAASITHPHVCQLYEIGEVGDTLFITMELLTGEPLSERLERGALPVREAVQVAQQVLAALSALHLRGIVHRDLKPSNIYLTGQGAKLLDFGVARAGADAQMTMMSLTQPGTVLGTPRYMAPEHASGEPVDARSDLFSVGAVLYEMLAGRPAFGGDTTVRVLHAVMHDQPPMLTGPPVVVALDRVIHRAMEKRQASRYDSAEKFADDLRAACSDSGALEAARARQMSRLIVLPFRLLRPDAEVDFLAFSLADAVTTSLSALGSLIVRSSITASKFTGEPLDLQKIATEADVDVVLSGTILRAGNQVRLSAQLAEAPGGALVWSEVVQVASDDIFQLHDTLVHKLVQALSVPLTAREHRLIGRDVPATAKAYEFYLRGNEAGKEPSGWDAAVELYSKCLDQDPNYAPAWARLGRVYRLLSKYRSEHSGNNRAHARHALDRALALNPDLFLAHHFAAQVDVDSGDARLALTRLLQQASQSAGHPELYAALCHVCRYCGLLEPSVAAHMLAARLDPKVATSVLHTWFHLRQYERIVECDLSGHPHNGALALHAVGRIDDAIALVRATLPKAAPLMRPFIQAAQAVLEGESVVDLARLRSTITEFDDPEGTYYLARTMARLGDFDSAVLGMTRAVEHGYCCYPTFEMDAWLDPLRGRADFDAVIARARTGYEAALDAFRNAGGERLLGVTVPEA
ncbi:MAG: protein kinase domain-containing protein [Acidobacteriota bacterium]